MIKIISVGKKHESWINPGIQEFSKRLKKPFDIEWQIISGSNLSGNLAREEESSRIIQKLNNQDFIILLDERGKNISNLELTDILNKQFNYSNNITIIIGGAFGVSDKLRQCANFVWSFSRLVFPHQLVRLMLVEQIYRAQEIARGGKYHHE